MSGHVAQMDNIILLFRIKAPSKLAENTCYEVTDRTSNI